MTWGNLRTPKKPPVMRGWVRGGCLTVPVSFGMPRLRNAGGVRPWQKTARTHAHRPTGGRRAPRVAMRAAKRSAPRRRGRGRPSRPSRGLGEGSPENVLTETRRECPLHATACHCVVQVGTSGYRREDIPTPLRDAGGKLCDAAGYPAKNTLTKNITCACLRQPALAASPGYRRY